MDEMGSGRTLDDPLDAYRNVDRTPRRSPCWVAGHMVAGLDGTAAVDGRVGALSTTPDQLLFRRMRELADVVLVGAETVRREGYGPVRLDAPAQAARTALGMPPTPPLAIVTRSLDLDFSAAAFAEAPGHARTLVLTGENADRARRAAAAEAAEVVIAGREGVEPRAALGALGGLPRLGLDGGADAGETRRRRRLWRDLKWRTRCAGPEAPFSSAALDSAFAPIGFRAYSAP